MSVAYRNALPYVNPMLYSTAGSETGADGFNGAATLGAGWGQAHPASVLHSARFDSSAPHQRLSEARWSEATPAGDVVALPVHQLRPEDRSVGLRYGDCELHEADETSAPFRQSTPHDAEHSLPFGDLDVHAAVAAALPFHQPAACHGELSVPWGTLAAHALSHSLLWRRLVERGAYVALRWSPVAARSSSTVIVWPPTPPTDDDTIIVPDLPVYVMLPTMTAVRLPDRTPIPLLSISLQEEAGGFAWSFSAPMARTGLALVNPDTGDAPQIEVTINGYVWTFIVDGYDDNRRFSSNTLTLRGRSLAAGLAAPHAATRTFTQAADRDASQLASEELPVGWTLLWDAVDWLVPGGTFSYQDLAPIEAIAQVASAIGAAVRSHPSEPTLEVVPTYPVSPWAWDEAAPYAILPAGVLGDGSSSWQGGVNPNGIFVYAQNAPSGARVTIAGTDGAIQLPMVVDPLLVHADAQRERGRHELASAGKARTVQRTVPLFPSPAPEGMPELGVVRPGALLELQDPDETWLGMVTAVRIDAQRSGRALSVRQHLTIERQYR